MEFSFSVCRSRTVIVNVCLEERFRIGIVNWRSRDSFKPYRSDWMLEEQRSRIRASSAVLGACSFRRYKSDSMSFLCSREAILRPSTSVGIIRVSVPRLGLVIGNFDTRSLSRSPVRRTFRERINSSETARGDISPPNSLTKRSNSDFAPPIANNFGFPFCVRNRGSVSHPCTTRSDGMLAARCESRLDTGRSSIRLISFRGSPVRAATFEWLTFPFRSRELPAAARTKASRARLENRFGVMPRGSSASASSSRKCCRSACAPSVSFSRPRLRGCSELR